jgi:dihydroceramidase
MTRTALETGYFINQDHDDARSSTGYWGPPTSSIDFCESNYLLSYVIVEPHNVWSSLFGLSLVGVLGIIYGNPVQEWRFVLIYFILFMIGIGSACLHATLHWSFQSSDELPMVYLIVALVYIVLEVDSPRGTSKYPEIPKYLFLLSCINTAVYFVFQQLYLMFLATFTGLTIVLTYFHVQIAWRLCQENRYEKKEHNINNTLALRFYMWHYIAFIIVAVPIWILDQFHCGYLLSLYNNLPFPFRGMTLHVVWHICAGIATHFLVQFLCACRANALGMVCDMRYVLWIFPVVVITPKTRQGLKV